MADDEQEDEQHDEQQDAQQDEQHDDLHELQEQIFELVRRSQEALLDATRVFTDRLAAAVPGDPNQLDDLIDGAYDLTERVLRAQRDLAKKVVEAVTTPLTPGGGDDR